MTTRLRIAVADDEAPIRHLLKCSLELLGHQVQTVSSGRDLVELCQTHEIDLVFTDIGMSPVDGLQAAEQIYEHRPVPIIVVSGHKEPEEVGRACSAHIFAYLVKPIRTADLGPAIEIAQGRFKELQVLHEEAACLRRALSDRKIIEQAKGIVMRQSGLDEAAAFQRIQKLARSKSKKLIEIADMIVTANEVVVDCV